MNNIKKRKVCDEINEQHMVKRIKLDFDDQESTKSKNDMTILDVIDDCLVEIFVYLQLKDLLCLAATNSRFKIPTERAFVHLHRNIPVIASNIDSDGVEGEMLKYSTNILKKFGHCITKLCIQFKLENIDRLLAPIVKYAGDSIVKLKFYHNEEWYFELHRTGLRRIKRHLRELNKKFPNLRYLKFEYDDYDLMDCPYSDEIIQAIPTLKTFSAAGLIFSQEDVNQFIALNGQLESLRLWVPNGFINQSFMNNMDVSLPKLQSIKMNRITIEGALDPIDPNRFKNLRQLTYGSFSTFFPVNGLTSLFGEGIEKLDLYCRDYVMTNISENISQLRKLTQLNLFLAYSLPVPCLHTFDESIVSPMAIRDLILRNKQLTEIRISWQYHRMHLNDFQNKYKTEILDGAQWYVRVRQWAEEDDNEAIHISVSFAKEKKN